MAARSGPPDYSSTSRYPGTPRWVKLFAAALLIVVLLVVIVMTVGAGQHSPLRHMPSTSPAGHIPNASQALLWA